MPLGPLEYSLGLLKIIIIGITLGRNQRPMQI